LREEVSLRSMPTILEVLADNASRTKDPETLTELVRQRLGRALCEQYADSAGVVHAVTLDPDVEAGLANAVGQGPGDGTGPVSPAWLQELVEQIGEQISQATKNGKDVVLLVRSNVRRFVGELVRASLPRVAVLSYSEVVAARSVETAAIVKMEA
jgi:flagellar biosynthesis protein FlhA